MSEYIEREAFMQIIAAQCGECADACLEFDGIQPDCNQCLLNGAKKAIEAIPAADVRPVVLCKDCKYNKGTKTWIDNDLTADCTKGHGYPPLDWFCADGEKRRKEGGKLMYDELIGRLRANGELFLKYIPNAEGEILLQAADAIEELQKAVNFHKFNSEFWEDKYNSLADEKCVPEPPKEDEA